MTQAPNAMHGILLESGTNEVEILEFVLRDQGFGVNVAKVRQIVPFEPAALSVTPDRIRGMMGMYLYRGTTVPMVDLAQVLGMDRVPATTRQPLAMVCEFNTVVTAFYVDGVNRIHRVSWDGIQPMMDILGESNSYIISSVTVEGHEVLIVDLEHIVIEMNPRLAQATRAVGAQQAAAASVTDRTIRLVMAEDSGFVRQSMLACLQPYEFLQVEACTNGQQAYDLIARHIEQARRESRPVSDFVHMVLTDIEMPQMDGLTLCKHIKTTLGQPDMPVVVYSSLINEQMARKCEAVGASAYFSKPHINELISKIMRFIEQLPRTTAPARG